jgi:hypothetical protein
MVAMIIDSNIVWGLVMALGVVIMVAVVYFMKLKRTVPEAFVLMQARDKKIPVIMYHYPNNVTKLVFPELEQTVEDIANYFKADGVYKFWDASGQNYERLNGDVTLYHVLSNVPETVNHKIAAVMSQVEAFLKNSGFPIDGMQDLFFYVLSEVEKEVDTGKVDPKTGDAIVTKRSMDEVLKSISLDDLETKERVKSAVKFLQGHKDQFEQLVPYFRPVPFSFQTMIRSWDNLMAFTSKNFMQAKTIIETAVRREGAFAQSQVLMYAFGSVIVLAGMVFVFKAMGWA